MKLFKHLAVSSAIALTILSSCSGGGASKSESLLYGNLPAVHSEMQEAKNSIKEEFIAAKSESQGKDLIEKANKLEKEYSEKIEAAAKALDNREINFSEGDLKITAPVTLTYESFFSQSDMTPYFKVNGSAEAATDITFAGEHPLSGYNVYIVGYGPDNEELFASKVGMIDAEINGETAVIKAGTPVKFDRLQFSSNETDEYRKTASLKLEPRDSRAKKQ